MFGVEMPRETMLITSVSASTAQIDEQVSGSSACERERADLVDRDAEVAADVLEELPRARGALAGHAVAEHLGALVDEDGARVQRADVDDRARLGVEEERRRARASSCRRSGRCGRRPSRPRRSWRRSRARRARSPASRQAARRTARRRPCSGSRRRMRSLRAGEQLGAPAAAVVARSATLTADEPTSMPAARQRAPAPWRSCATSSARRRRFGAARAARTAPRPSAPV